MYQAERSWRYARNAARLANRDGADSLQRLTHFAGKSADGVVLNPFRNRHSFGCLEFLNRLLLLIEISGEFDFRFDCTRLVAECCTRLGALALCRGEFSKQRHGG